MNNLTKALEHLFIVSSCTLQRSGIHTTSTLFKKIKKPAEKISDLPEPIKTSWGRMVSRGMRPREPVNEYTTKGLKVFKTGGRGVHGKIEIKRIGGGKPVVWHMADLVRISETEPDPKVEIVREIIPEQTRSAFLALVAGGEHKRWIIATEDMKVGDIIKSTRDLPKMPVQPQPGDSHPIGALPIGTQVCCVERFPYEGSKVANGAGTYATIVKKVDNNVVVKMPSKREMVIDEKCLCVAGRVSNIERNKIHLGKAGASRWLGIRPKSGHWMRKTGLHGRKIKPIKKAITYDKKAAVPPGTQTFTVDKNLFERLSPLHSGL